MEYTINIRGQLLDLSQPQVMGILNVTPDSFYAGSRKQTEREIAERAVEIVSQGGSMIDIGAFSTRPGAQEVDEEEEGKRLQWALSIVRREVPDAIISVDTYRPSLARRCINDWGADIINDVSEGGLTGIVGVAIHEKERMFDVIGELKCPYILMSVKPTLPDMLLAFADEIQQLRDRGCKDIILDPGFGFGKTLEQNYAILADIDKLQVLELPILVGISRKSMIYKWTGGTPDTALAGTTALHAAAIMKGASILRVHDVKAASDTIAVTQKMLSYLNS
ncbi:MAG: dihydropteroate synthase [Prevotellaceae bacterium]|nr:dihydropteroate synthase [Prevotellaceae bacterium]